MKIITYVLSFWFVFSVPVFSESYLAPESYISEVEGVGDSAVIQEIARVLWPGMELALPHILPDHFSDGPISIWQLMKIQAVAVAILRSQEKSDILSKVVPQSLAIEITRYQGRLVPRKIYLPIQTSAGSYVAIISGSYSEAGDRNFNIEWKKLDEDELRRAIGSALRNVIVSAISYAPFLIGGDVESDDQPDVARITRREFVERVVLGVAFVLAVGVNPGCAGCSVSNFELQVQYSGTSSDKGWPILQTNLAGMPQISPPVQGQLVLLDEVVGQNNQDQLRIKNLRLAGEAKTVSILKDKNLTDSEIPSYVTFALDQERSSTIMGEFHVFRGSSNEWLAIPVSEVLRIEAGQFIQGNSTTMHIYVLDGSLEVTADVLNSMKDEVDTYEAVTNDLIVNGVYGNAYTDFLIEDVLIDRMLTGLEPGGALEVTDSDMPFPDGTLPTTHNYWAGNTAQVLIALMSVSSPSAEASQKIVDMVDWLIGMQMASGSYLMKLGGYNGVYTKVESPNRLDNALIAVDVSQRQLTLLRGYENFSGGQIGAPGLVVRNTTSGATTDLSVLNEGTFTFNLLGITTNAQGDKTAQRSFDSQYVTVIENVTIKDGFQSVEVSYEYRVKPGYEITKFYSGGFGNAASQYPWTQNFVTFPQDDETKYSADSFTVGQWPDFFSSIQNGPGLVSLFSWDRALIGKLPNTRTYTIDGDPVTFSVNPSFAMQVGQTENNARTWDNLRMEQSLDSSEYVTAGEVLTVGPSVYNVFWLPVPSTGSTLPPDLLELSVDWNDARQADEQDNISYESDYAYLAPAVALARAYNYLNPSTQTDLRNRARDSALLAAQYALDVYNAMLEDVRNGRSNPSYGIMRFYAYHVELFNWAYQVTNDSQWHNALVQLADGILALQVTDQADAKFGGIKQNEGQFPGFLLDDQGMKLWALRKAFDVTGDTRYRTAAQRVIENWLKLSSEDGLFEGLTRDYDASQDVLIGFNQQRTGYGQACMLYGLAHWSDVFSTAREKFLQGFQYFRDSDGFNGLTNHGIGPMLYVGKDSPFYFADVNSELTPILLSSILEYRTRVPNPFPALVPIGGLGLSITDGLYQGQILGDLADGDYRRMLQQVADESGLDLPVDQIELLDPGVRRPDLGHLFLGWSDNKRLRISKLAFQHKALLKFILLHENDIFRDTLGRVGRPERDAEHRALFNSQTRFAQLSPEDQSTILNILNRMHQEASQKNNIAPISILFQQSSLHRSDEDRHDLIRVWLMVYWERAPSLLNQARAMDLRLQQAA